MTLGNLRECYDDFGIMHIATGEGEGLLYTGINKEIPTTYNDREILLIQHHEGRDFGDYFYKLGAGIFALIAGNERGKC